MEQVFENLKEIEKQCGIFLSADDKIAESIMIENAAGALLKEVKNACSKKKSAVTVLCGSGNNGADGYTLCRQLAGICRVNVIKIKEPVSYHCCLAYENLKKVFENTKCDINFYELALMQGQTSVEKIIKHSDVIVDCIFGTGFHGTVDASVQNLFAAVNKSDAVRIACDIPSGIDSNGENISSLSFDEKKKFVFSADVTVSMGAHKINLFSDSAKDSIGKIRTASIGVSKQLFHETSLNVVKDHKIFLLNKEDLMLPVRNEQNSHKGKFGHICVIAGTKAGAGIIAASSGFKTGAGLSTLVVNPSLDFENFKIPVSIMVSEQIPETASSFVLGPGFGREQNIDKWLNELKTISAEKKISVVFDADCFYYSQTVDFLEENSKCENPVNVVITPHPKEFSMLLKLSGIGEYSVKEVCDRRLELCRIFSERFKNTVLVLKGSNTFIASSGTVYISTCGTAALSKGGSGDVLAGVIGALLAQKYKSVDAAISGVLMHSIASKKIEKNYSLTPELLIEML